MSDVSEKRTKRLRLLLESAVLLARAEDIRRILILVRETLENRCLDRESLPSKPSILWALDSRIQNYEPPAGQDCFYLHLPDTMPLEALELCLQTAVKLERVKMGERILCLFPLANPFEIDSMTSIQLREKAGYISLQKLAKLADSIPVPVLQSVLTVAMEVAREGREGSSVGALFVVGDSQKVLEASKAMIMNPFHGYPEDQRRITDPSLIETVKEICQIDGGFIIRSDGVILSAGRYIDTTAKGVQVPRGLGARHMAAAAISKSTDAIAVAVSASTRTVRVFRKGKIVLETKPLRGLWI
ncbi:MAG: diadenylate cyclase [bacterium]